MDERTLHGTKLHIKLTDRGMLIYGGWSNERLLGLLKDKLRQCDEIKSSSMCTVTRCDASLNKSLSVIIHNGIYNECILLELIGKGISLYGILKAMKYGLLGLTSEELNYFEGFGAKKNVDKTWTKRLDEKLIWNLATTGLTEVQCWDIVMCGLVSQDKSILCQLSSNGIDVLGILDWPGKVKSASPLMIRFLKKLGIDEDTVRYVEQNGINDEVEDMLIDLGYNEYKEKEILEITEGILCECSLIILKEETTSIVFHNPLLKTKILPSYSLNNKNLSSNISFTNMQYDSITSTSYSNLLPKGRSNEALKKKDYLRDFIMQHVMIPLSWAVSRALKYQPSDPKHYIAHQLLRWRYGNVPQEEIRSAEQFAASTMIIIDRELAKKHKREEDAIGLNETATKDIIYDVHLGRQKLYRIKKCCWKCIRMPILTREK